MRWLSKLRLRVRSLLGKPALDRELDEEIRFHIERQIEENVAAGMEPEAARRAALREFGGVEPIKEECRDARGVTLAHDLVRDLRVGARQFRRSPAFTAVVVLILALGIGASTAIFSFIDAVMLRGLPVRDPDELVVLSWRARTDPDTRLSMTGGDCNGLETSPMARVRGPGPGAAGCSFSRPFFDQLRDDRGLLAGLTAFGNAPPLLVSGHGSPQRAYGQLVSGDYFAVLGVGAALGRTLDRGDEQRAAPVAVLSHAYWLRAFGGDPSIVGRTVRLNGALFTVVGVADPDFTRLTPGNVHDLWLPLSVRRLIDARWDQIYEGNASWLLTLVGRLRPGVPAAQVEAAATVAFRGNVLGAEGPLLTAADHPEVRVAPATSGLTGARVQYRQQLLVMSVAVGVLLAIACANVAGLLLARAGSRRREIALRLALGAGRGRIVRQLLAESTLLAVAGGALGALLATWGVEALVAFMSQSQSRPLGFDVAVDGRVLAFTALVSLTVGVAFGLAPALRATRVDVASTLKEGALATSGVRARLGAGLVVAQVALSVVILVGAGLFLRTLDELRGVDPGFRTENVLLFDIDPTLAGYPPPKIDALYRELRDGLADLPGVTSASWSEARLLAGAGWAATLRLPAPARIVDVDLLRVGPGFFQTLGVPVLAGRALSAEDIAAAPAGGDANANGTRTAVVNQAFARRFFPGRSPLGEGFQFDGRGPEPTWQIVGVVGDIKYSELRRDVWPTIYVPSQRRGVAFEVRTAADPMRLVPKVQALVARLAPDLAPTDVKTQSDEIDRLLFRERIMARLSGLFALLALALSCLGLYALLAHEVARRTREVGIRMALGARDGDVRRMVVAHGLALTATGIVLGIAAAAAVTRSLGAFLYGVAPTDPVVLASVSGLLLAVAFVACYLPARQATRVDPMLVLRSD